MIKRKILFRILLCALFVLLSVAGMTSCEKDTFDIRFESMTYEYDGKEKSITVDGVPEGAEVEYTGERKQTQVGVYPVTATVTLPDGSTIELEATLTIKQPTDAPNTETPDTGAPDTGAPDTGAPDTEDTKFTYTLTEEGNAVVTGYKASDTEITVPETIDGHTVTQIGASAFAQRTSLQSITLPNTITTIGEKAFQGCTCLSSVTLSDALASIGENAFQDCDTLDFTVQNNCRYLGSKTNPYLLLWQALDSAATSVTLNDDSKIIYDRALRDFSKLMSIELPAGIRYIGRAAFENCSSLTAITIPEGVERIEAFTFKSSGIQSITLPASLTYVGVSAFESSKLASVTIPDNVTVIDQHAFAYCNSLRRVDSGVASRLTTIGAFSFVSIDNLQFIYIPAGISTLGAEAFYLSHIDTVVIGTGTKLKSTNGAFNCSKLEKVYFGGSIADWADIEIRDRENRFKTADRYYYSETEPTEDGNYWHYSENGDIVIW